MNAEVNVSNFASQAPRPAILIHSTALINVVVSKGKFVEGNQAIDTWDFGIVGGRQIND